MTEHRGPSEAVLMDAVARRHYLRGQSKVEIASALGISRFKVARLLEEAVASGVVRIEIVAPPGLDAELSDRLRRAYHLRYSVVVPSGSETRAALGRAAADLLVEVLTSDDVLGLPWSRSVNDVVNLLTALPTIPVVQLCGGLVIAGEDGSSSDVVRRAARLAGGPSHVFYAPMLLDDAESASALRKLATVRDALAHVPTVTVAIMGVGGWLPGASTICDVVSPETRAQVAAAGVVGDMGGVLFDVEGLPVECELSARIVALTGAQLQAIPHVIGVAHGVEKVEAIDAAIRGGLLDSLVTTAATAEALIDLSASTVQQLTPSQVVLSKN